VRGFRLNSRNEKELINKSADTFMGFDNSKLKFKSYMSTLKNNFKMIKTLKGQLKNVDYNPVAVLI